MKIPVKQGIFYLFFTAVFFSLLTGSCAREAMPLGGPKDTIPPRVIMSYPEPFQTNFKDKKLVIKFDEFFDLKNLQKEFFVSPPFAHKPVFAIRGKRLIIKLKDNLRDSVTYTFEFGNAIVDYTEGNPLENFKLIFSTYDQIDTLRLQGKVLDAATGEPVEGAYVMLYRKDAADSVVYKEPPVYVTVTDKEGKFQIIGVKKDCYKVVAINDLNHDFIYDGIENQIAFLDTLACVDVRVDTVIDHVVDTTMKDTTLTGLQDTAVAQHSDTLSRDSSRIKYVVRYLPGNIVLHMFEEHTRPQQVVLIKRPLPFLCVIRFSYPLRKNYYQIIPMQGDTSDYIYFYDPQVDSLDVWIKNEAISQQDTLGFIVDYLTPMQGGDEHRQDTLFFTRPQKLSYRIDLKPLSDEIEAFDSLVLLSNIYLSEYYTDSMQLVQILDTSLYDPKDVKVRMIRVEPDVVDVDFSLPLVTRYKAWVNGSLVDARSIIYDTAKSRLVVRLPEEYKDLDTVEVKLDYWLKRFNNYEEFHHVSKKLDLTRQQLVKAERVTWDSLVLFFVKPLRKLQLPSDSVTWKQVSPYIVSVKLKYPQDTVFLRIKTLDFEHLGDKPIYYEKVIESVYQWKPNKVRTVARVNRQRVVMIFDRKPAGIFMINTLDPKVQGDRNNYTLRGDTLTVDFLSKEFKRMKVNKIIVGHYDLDRRERVKLYDTVDAEIGENPLLKSTKIYVPQEFNFYRSGDNPLEMILSAGFKPDSKYTFLAMPGSFVDVTGHANDSVYMIQFKTTDTREYGSLKINFTDDSLYFTHSQLIVQLLDKDNNIVGQYFVPRPELSIPVIKPGDYAVRIIFDLNKNGRWDTGNYLRHEQPEPVVLLQKKLSAKANWQIEETISMKILEKK